jgi:hypothetical protein
VIETSKGLTRGMKLILGDEQELDMNENIKCSFMKTPGKKRA